MATYVILANWTDQGIRNVKDTIPRAQHFRNLCEQRGVKVLSFYWTQGRYDNIVVVEAPEEQAVMASIFASCQMGNIRSETLRAFNESDMSAILQQV
jgi:uncharacterized protein with GYD domain